MPVEAPVMRAVPFEEELLMVCSFELKTARDACRRVLKARGGEQDGFLSPHVRCICS
jgi:hypothetical protein